MLSFLSFPILPFLLPDLKKKKLLYREVSLFYLLIANHIIAMLLHQHIFIFKASSNKLFAAHGFLVVYRCLVYILGIYELWLCTKVMFLFDFQFLLIKA